MPSFRIRSASAAAVLALCGCLMKERPEKPAAAALMPPWDPSRFAPKQVEASPDTGHVFAVFDSIARIDSLAGDPKGWKAEEGAVDTLRIEHLFDTAFVFPRNPEASIPYAYDDSYRDDTLWRNSYGNGLFTQDHPCAANYVLSGEFLHPAKWLKTGLSGEDIVRALGNPSYRQPGVLRYLSKHPGPEPERAPVDTLSTAADYSSYDIYEGVNLYFERDSLFAAVLQKSGPCH